MTTVDFYLNDIWSKTIKNIANSNQISESVLPYFESKLVSLDNDEATIVVPNFINYSIMTENVGIIENCLENVLEKKMKIHITQQNDSVPLASKQNVIKSDFLSREIDPNQTLTNFITGRSNVQAHLAATTVALNPGIIYNPLFIYGNSGL